MDTPSYSGVSGIERVTGKYLKLGKVAKINEVTGQMIVCFLWQSVLSFEETCRPTLTWHDHSSRALVCSSSTQGKLQGPLSVWSLNPPFHLPSVLGSSLSLT